MLRSLSIAALLLPAALLATPASATDARSALASCTANPACSARVDADGGVVIGVGGKVIYCPPKNGECEVVRRAGNRWLSTGADLPAIAAAENGAVLAVENPAPAELLKKP